MLSIGKIGAGAGHEYLSKGVTKDSMEYYGGKGERCGRWTGVEAEKLGLAGEIDPDSDAVEALYGRGETPEGVRWVPVGDLQDLDRAGRRPDSGTG